MIKVDEDENAICCNEGNRTSLSIARICMRIRDGSDWVAKLLQSGSKLHKTHIIEFFTSLSLAIY